MSRLEELIQELCPDGVKFYPLGQVAHYSKRRIDASQVDNTTYVSVENLLQNKQGKTTASFVPETGAVIAFDEGDILIGNIRPYLRKIWLADCCGGTNGDVLAIQIKDKATLTPKFLYYILSSEDFFRYDIQNSKGAKMPRGSKEAVLNYQVPVPPLPIQAEIVRILDNFTERTTELAEQLTAELTARKKQYEYYRDKLLTFGVHGGGASDAVWRTLADLGKWSGGKTPSMSEHDYWAAGKIPWLTSKDMKCSTLTDTQDHITEIAVKNASMTLYPKNSIAIVTRSGILKHTFPVAYVPFSTTVNQDIKVLEVNETVIPRYAFHLLQGKGQDILARTKKQGGTVDSLDFQKLLTYRVPVPPLSIQQRIVNVLDNFDAVCTDLKISLPAEIEARQKQYEYYRDLLLSFDDCSQLVHVERERERERERPERQDVIKLLQYVFGYVILPLEQCCVILDKKRMPVTKSVRVAGEYPYYGANGIQDYVSDYIFDGVFVLVGEDGSVITKGGKPVVTWAEGKIWVNNHAHIIAQIEDVSLRYLFHYIQTVDVTALIHGNIPKLTGKDFRNILIYLPPIKEQVRRATILDRLYALYNDLTSGLSAEIEARQRQYEHYRDKLLTFKELNP